MSMSWVLKLLTKVEQEEMTMVVAYKVLRWSFHEYEMILQCSLLAKSKLRVLLMNLNMKKQS